MFWHLLRKLTSALRNVSNIIYYNNLYHVHCDIFVRRSSEGRKRRGSDEPMHLIDSLPELIHVMGDRYDMLHKMLNGEMSAADIDKV